VDIGKIKIDNKQSIELENGSRVKATTNRADAGRSESVSLLVVDEAAHIEKFNEIWTGVSPTISLGGSVIIMSTPNGTGNIFHQLYEQAVNNENGFNCKFGTYVNPHNPSEIYNDRFMWWVRPEYDLEWFAAETRDKSPREIHQEFCCNFAASGETFIYSDDIVRLEKLVKEPKEFWKEDRNVWIWELPEKNASYLITADISSRNSSRLFCFSCH